MSKIIEKDLSYRINGCIFDVHNEVGPGLREACYQKAMERCLLESDLQFIAKPKTRGELVYRNVICDVFEPDLIVDDRVIVEFKHQPQGLSRENFTQVLNYLKFYDLRLGLLVNFAMNKAIIERVPYDPREAEVIENYEQVNGLIREEHRTSLRAIRDGLLELNAKIGIGYHDKTCRNLVIAEMCARGLECDADIEVTPMFRGFSLPLSAITPILVEGQFCVQVEAIAEKITARAVRALQTHLRLTGCEIGFVVCFGKTQFEICGVCR